MMQDISTTLKGRIGSDPSMKKVRGDTCVTTFRLAIPRWRFATDARTGHASYVEDGAYWYTIETWETLAKNVFECCHKGEPVIVVARPVPNAWVDGNGQIRSSIVFRASAVGHDIARGRSEFTKNGAQSSEEPPGGHPDDPFSTRPTQPACDSHPVGVAGFDAPSALAEAGAQGAQGAGSQLRCPDGDATHDGCGDVARQVEPAAAIEPSDRQCTQIHDGSEEHSSDPRVHALSRFDYSAVGLSRRSPDETAQPIVPDGQAPSPETDAPELDESDDC